MPRRAGRSSFPSSSFRRGARPASVLVQLPCQFSVGGWQLAVPLSQLPTAICQLFLRSFLLPCDRALARSLAGAGVGVRALAAGGQTAAVAHAAVAVDLHQPLDVQADVLAEVALDLPLVGDDLADLAHVVLGEVLDARVAVDARVREDVVRPRAADAENISQTDFHSLVQWEINACDTCHVFSES